MKLALVLSTTECETLFNAFRLGNFALDSGDSVRVFLLGKAVEIEQIEDPKFNVREQARTFVDDGGEILACGTCLKLRQSEGSELCPLSTMKDLYEMVRDADRVLTF